MESSKRTEKWLVLNSSLGWPIECKDADQAADMVREFRTDDTLVERIITVTTTTTSQVTVAEFLGEP